MPKLSLKKILAVVLALVLLAYSRSIYEAIRHIWDWLATGLEPLRHTPPELRYVVTLLLLAFIFVFLYRLFMNRGKRGKS